MRKAAFLWLAALAMSVTSSAFAEKVTVTNVIPAKFAEAAQLRTIVVQQFSGDGGEQLSSAITAELSRPDVDGTPHFIVTTSAAGGRASGVGVMTGSVSMNVSQSAYTDQQSRCVEGQGFFSCKRRVTVNVSCTRRSVMLTVSIKIVRASDRRIIYSLSEPFNSNDGWCEGQAPTPIAQYYATFVTQLATRVAHEISPHTQSYSLRLIERTDGLDKPSAKAFKAAIKIAQRDFKDSCQQWQALQSAGQKSGALLFDLGVCAELATNLAGASALYDQALALSPGDKQIAEAATRARNLIVAQRAAISQVADRARTEANEAAADRRTRQAEERATASTAAAARRKAAQAAAEAANAKAKQRASVAATYGAGAADSIIAGTVRVGMSAAQARAAVGTTCAIRRFGANEELWTCGAKRIGFAKGRVTFVR
jgi:hypothetical protein